MAKKYYRNLFIMIISLSTIILFSCGGNAELSDDSIPTTSGSGFDLADTNQSLCYNTNTSISCPSSSTDYFGQDAQYDGLQPSYTDNGDGTITDNNTDLMWQQDPGDKMTYSEAESGADSFTLAGYSDWRLPTIKELYSLIIFSGEDPSGYEGTDTSGLIPFIDTNYFAFEYGDTDSGDRIIDSQWTTSNVYESTVMSGSECFFGVNFADGRIKCYGTESENSGFFTIYVRGETYGVNDFLDNSDNTLTDNATALMWMQIDSGSDSVSDQLSSFTYDDGSLNWEEALSFCENLSFATYTDWRLPDAKEMQSIVDYTRSPDTTNSAAIDSLFSVTAITDEGGNTNYPFYWTSTTHADSNSRGANAVYVSFGEALGYMNGSWIDVHGAGAQRSDPKTGNPDDYPTGHGPQGDAIRIYNYVRCVRDVS